MKTVPVHPLMTLCLHCSPTRVARAYHTAWTPASQPDKLLLLGGITADTEYSAEVLPGVQVHSPDLRALSAGGGSFSVRHSVDRSCGVEDGSSVVMVGGSPSHRHVDRSPPDIHSRTYLTPDQVQPGRLGRAVAQPAGAEVSPLLWQVYYRPGGTGERRC